MVPPHGTVPSGKIQLKQLLKLVKFGFVARVTLKLWHKNIVRRQGCRPVVISDLS